MEFLVINESKLKIIMTPEDTAKYEFQASGADYDSPDTRRVFWRIIDEATANVGFDPKGDKILIQLYPSRDGGCEIFVTKLGALSPTAAKLVARSENVTMLTRECFLYLFENRAALASAMESLKRMPKSEAYEAPSGEIIFLVEECIGGVRGEYPSLGEFATRIPKEMLYYAREHFSAIPQSDIAVKSTFGG